MDFFGDKLGLIPARSADWAGARFVTAAPRQPNSSIPDEAISD